MICTQVYGIKYSYLIWIIFKYSTHRMRPNQYNLLKLEWAWEKWKWRVFTLSRVIEREPHHQIRFSVILRRRKLTPLQKNTISVLQTPLTEPYHSYTKHTRLYASIVVCLFLHGYLSICLSIYVSISIYLSIYQCFSLYLSISLSLFHTLSLSLSLSLSLYLSIYLSIKQIAESWFREHHTHTCHPINLSVNRKPNRSLYVLLIK